MWNFVPADKATYVMELYPPKQTRFHMQKYDGLENIEKPSRALGITLGSRTNTILSHNHIKKRM
jgi:hypothetical protein